LDGDGDSTTFAVAKAISAYLRSNPLAADTARGVLEWWLRGTARDVEQVRRALDLLTARGIVVSARNPDGRRIWSAGPLLFSGNVE
jgi:hypothetical protein